MGRMGDFLDLVPSCRLWPLVHAVGLLVIGIGEFVRLYLPLWIGPEHIVVDHLPLFLALYHDLLQRGHVHHAWLRRHQAGNGNGCDGSHVGGYTGIHNAGGAGCNLCEQGGPAKLSCNGVGGMPVLQIVGANRRLPKKWAMELTQGGHGGPPLLLSFFRLRRITDLGSRSVRCPAYKRCLGSGCHGNYGLKVVPNCGTALTCD